jgi:hypothetical protein
MVDCAHRAWPFDKMDKVDCTRLQMRLMRIIKETAVTGIVQNIKNVQTNTGGSYFEAAKGAATTVVDWANKTAYNGKIDYFLESGANGKGEVDDWFGQVARDPKRQASYRYAGHSFIPKEDNPGVQAADLLAWQYQNYTKKRQTKNLARLDLRALLRHPHHMNDECGELPREPKIQTVEQSRTRRECIYYLPRASKNQIEHGSVLKPTADFTPVEGSNVGQVLACPDCLRAVGEDISINFLINIVIRCFCGTYCFCPGYMIPANVGVTTRRRS